MLLQVWLLVFCQESSTPKKLSGEMLILALNKPVVCLMERLLGLSCHVLHSWPRFADVSSSVLHAPASAVLHAQTFSICNKLLKHGFELVLVNPSVDSQSLMHRKVELTIPLSLPGDG
jgi:hypothetical protein